MDVYTGLKECLCSFCSSDDDTLSIASTLPLLDPRRTPAPSPPLPPLPPGAMPRFRAYGRKNFAASTAAAAIFGGEEATPRSPYESELSRSALADITSAIANVRVSDSEDEDGSEEEIVADENAEIDESSSASISIVADPLLPFTSAYEADCGVPILLQRWHDILPDSATLSKIAEASYAEVYRITTTSGTSILKIMHLKLESDPFSLELETALDVSLPISEIRIMNALTEVPGFVLFKDAYLIRGIPSNEIVTAYESHRKTQKRYRSSFPHPEKYSEDSTFLVIELGDAGEVLEDFQFESIDQVWDIFLGTVMALGRAESEFEFEHRDLHENNICISHPHKPLPHHNPTSLRFGFSGLEVTLIDYGLSRATLPNGSITYHDLETDIAIFQGPDTGPSAVQMDSYRRMRTHMIRNDHSLLPFGTHSTNQNFPPDDMLWQYHRPYTNVVWIRYLLQYLIKTFKKSPAGHMEYPRSSDSDALCMFKKEVAEMQTRLNPMTGKKKMPFESAKDVLDFAWQMGWVSEEQVECFGVDATILSERSQLIEADGEE